MPHLCVDRNMLYGIVALQKQFISRDQLIDAMHEWAEDRTRSLDRIVSERAGLDHDTQVLLDTLVGTELESADSESEDRSSALNHPPGEGQVSDLGPAARYRVLWPHAEGGLGRIHVAEDTELHRHVALKEIQPEHAHNPTSRQRFLFEGEVTANLEHPGIVPIHGRGTYADGRPFYAMRLIRGEDLATAVHRFHASESVDFNGRRFRWLVQRFNAVCNTIAYAHSQGVLHRDLKPGNIMLGPFGETLVLDWGVAKLMGHPGIGADVSAETATREESSLLPKFQSPSVTRAGHAVGTPAYMSPEQAGGGLGALGPASDVYSLGATLYVMLTDRRPFHGAVEDVLRAVRQGRFATARQINPDVPPPLDAICRRAMAVQPAQRYQSAQELGEDIERWLADEPVLAWREPWRDRWRRWIRRHQPFVAAAAATAGVALVTLVLIVPLLSLAWRNESLARSHEREQRIVALRRADEARNQRASAQAHANSAIEERVRAEKALKLLVAAFRRPDPAADGRTLKAIDLLRWAVNDIEKSMHDQPLMKATLLGAIGETFSGLGLIPEALSAMERSHSIRRETVGEDHPETLEAMENLAMAYQDAGMLEKAIPILRSALASRRELLGDEHADTLESMNDLAVAYWEDGQPARAIPLYEATLPGLRRGLGEDHPDTLTIMDNLAVAYAAVGRHDQAIRLHGAALAKLEARLGADHPSTLITMNNLARTYESGGRITDAIRLHEETLRKLGAKLGEDHPTTLVSMNSLARSYQAAGQGPRAISLFEATLAGRRVKLGADHPDTLMTVSALAIAYDDAKQPEKAFALASEFLHRIHKSEQRLPAAVRAAVPRAMKIVAGHFDPATPEDPNRAFREIPDGAAMP